MPNLYPLSLYPQNPPELRNIHLEETPHYRTAPWWDGYISPTYPPAKTQKACSNHNTSEQRDCELGNVARAGPGDEGDEENDFIKEMEMKMLDRCQSTPSRALTLPVIQIDQFYQINFPFFFLTKRESQSQWI